VIRKLAVALSAIVTIGLAVSPAAAQRKTHGAGVIWSGGHGGISWDGGHAYEGGGYGGYPAIARLLHHVQHTRCRSSRLTSPKLRSHSPSGATMLRVRNIAVLAGQIESFARF
jgi:hypothetical protein